jgi:hypothetical protein
MVSHSLAVDEQYCRAGGIAPAKRLENNLGHGPDCHPTKHCQCRLENDCTIGLVMADSALLSLLEDAPSRCFQVAPNVI